MAGRPITKGTAAHRERQRRYRERLSAAREPETDDVQRALLGSLIDAIAAARHGNLPSDPASRKALSDWILDLIKDTRRRLHASGYDPRALEPAPPPRPHPEGG